MRLVRLLIAVLSLAARVSAGECKKRSMEVSCRRCRYRCPAVDLTRPVTINAFDAKNAKRLRERASQDSQNEVGPWPKSKRRRSWRPPGTVRMPVEHSTLSSRRIRCASKLVVYHTGRRVCRLLVVLTLSLIALFVADTRRGLRAEAPTARIVGLGATSCQQFNDDVRSDPLPRRDYLAWASAYETLHWISPTL
jgi:hypothetical protein